MPGRGTWGGGGRVERLRSCSPYVCPEDHQRTNLPTRPTLPDVINFRNYLPNSFYPHPTPPLGAFKSINKVAPYQLKKKLRVQMEHLVTYNEYIPVSNYLTVPSFKVLEKSGVRRTNGRTKAVSLGLTPSISVARMTGNGSGFAGPSSIQTDALKRWDNLFDTKTGQMGQFIPKGVMIRDYRNKKKVIYILVQKK